MNFTLIFILRRRIGQFCIYVIVVVYCIVCFLTKFTTLLEINLNKRLASTFMDATIF
jgi:hypothetical protein